MAGKLYVTGTPIGNLSDISPRALETLKSVDFIAAEDTRVTGKLLNHFGIKKPMISYHKFSAEQREQEITDRIAAGESCAIVTDAGMPCISDPGEELVRCCHNAGIETVSVPGPSALITALALSGMNTSRFSFEGFLSVTPKQRRAHIEQIKTYPNTMIFYEAPHKLKNTLSDLLCALGDRNAVLCRELTKIHEEIIRGTLSYLDEYYNEKTPRGEYVLIIEGYRPARGEVTLDDAVLIAQQLVDSGKKPSDACKTAAAQTGLSKSEIYKALVGQNGE